MEPVYVYKYIYICIYVCMYRIWYLYDIYICIASIYRICYAEELSVGMETIAAYMKPAAWPQLEHTLTCSCKTNGLRWLSL